MRKIVMVCFLVLICIARASAEDKMLVAVLDFQAKNISDATAGAVTDMVRSEMVKSGLFTIIERSQINEVLKEQGFQMTGCTDQECAVEVGKLLSARKILVGEINRVAGVYILTVRIVDVEKGISEFSAKETAKSEGGLEKASERLTKNLCRTIVEGNSEYFESLIPITERGYYLRAIVPGWGQFYARNNYGGFIYSGLFIAAGVFTIYSMVDFFNKKNDYTAVERGAPRSEFDSKYEAWEDSQTVMYISIGALSLAYIANWVDILFFTKPDFSIKESPEVKSGAFFNIDAAGPLYAQDGANMRVYAGLRF